MHWCGSKRSNRTQMPSIVAGYLKKWLASPGFCQTLVVDRAYIMHAGCTPQSSASHGLVESEVVRDIYLSDKLTSLMNEYPLC